MSRLPGPAYRAREGRAGRNPAGPERHLVPSRAPERSVKAGYTVCNHAVRAIGAQPSRAQFLARRRPSKRCRVTQLAERNWQTLAACRSADPDLSFPLSSSGKSLGQAAEATRKRTPALIG